jgi:apoptotic chromatin condensation inducer in the nucleus
MMDEPVRVKDATATREPASQIVYIRGLTRPFTLPQLKELLSHYGALVDGEFWLDKIKSQCFVTVNISLPFPKTLLTYFFILV